MEHVYGQLNERLAVETDLPVLLLGETGTGKTTYAEHLHRCGRRRGGPFVCINVAELTGDLFASELFGYVRGAFTGALNDRVGLIEAAHGGTLFLDEIGELSLEQQAKLLRVLETRRVRRVGATSERQVDFRLIAATNRDLQAEVAAGRFRADLYQRLASGGVVVRLRSLSEMTEEELLLGCARLLGEINQRLGGQIYLSERLCRKLIGFEWPGNWRELGGCMQRIISLGMILGGNRGVIDLAMDRGEARNPQELLERVRFLPLSDAASPTVTIEFTSGEPLPLKRRRGRPRKNEAEQSVCQPICGQIVSFDERVTREVGSVTTSGVTAGASGEGRVNELVEKIYADEQVQQIYEELRRVVRCKAATLLNKDEKDGKTTLKTNDLVEVVLQTISSVQLAS